MPLPHFKLNKTTHSFAETQKIARNIGTSIQEPAVIALAGDLGSGKTTFVQGLARGLEIPPEYYITSPTFTLINRYPGRIPLFHVDLYRIEDPLEVEDIGLIEIMNGRGVVAIEWADRLCGDLPAERVALYFEILPDETRNITAVGYGDREVGLLDKIDTLLQQ